MSKTWGDLSQSARPGDVDFPHAPAGWTRANAENRVAAEGLELEDDHWEVVRALQEYSSRHDASGIKVRGLLDALDEKFHVKGGLKYLYSLFPGGPVAQGCRIAGLQAPAGSTDMGFGSVQ
jgi:tRNA 2-thiouridine synthesizing protein E